MLRVTKANVNAITSKEYTSSSKINHKMKTVIAAFMLIFNYLDTLLKLYEYTRLPSETMSTHQLEYEFPKLIYLHFNMYRIVS